MPSLKSPVRDLRPGRRGDLPRAGPAPRGQRDRGDRPPRGRRARRLHRHGLPHGVARAGWSGVGHQRDARRRHARRRRGLGGQPLSDAQPTRPTSSHAPEAPAATPSRSSPGRRRRRGPAAPRVGAWSAATLAARPRQNDHTLCLGDVLPRSTSAPTARRSSTATAATGPSSPAADRCPRSASPPPRPTSTAARCCSTRPRPACRGARPPRVRADRPDPASAGASRPHPAQPRGGYRGRPHAPPPATAPARPERRPRTLPPVPRRAGGLPLRCLGLALSVRCGRGRRASTPGRGGSRARRRSSANALARVAAGPVRARGLRRRAQGAGGVGSGDAREAHDKALLPRAAARRGARRGQRRVYDLLSACSRRTPSRRAQARRRTMPCAGALLRLRRRRLVALKRAEPRGWRTRCRPWRSTGRRSTACATTSRSSTRPPPSPTRAPPRRALRRSTRSVYDRRVTASLWGFDYTWEVYAAGEAAPQVLRSRCWRARSWWATSTRGRPRGEARGGRAFGAPRTARWRAQWRNSRVSSGCGITGASAGASVADAGREAPSASLPRSRSPRARRVQRPGARAPRRRHRRRRVGCGRHQTSPGRRRARRVPPAVPLAPPRLGDSAAAYSARGAPRAAGSPLFAGSTSPDLGRRPDNARQSYSAVILRALASGGDPRSPFSSRTTW